MAGKTLVDIVESSRDPSSFLGAIKQRASVLVVLAGVAYYQNQQIQLANEKTVKVLESQIDRQSAQTERAVTAHRDAHRVLEETRDAMREVARELRDRRTATRE